MTRDEDHARAFFTRQQDKLMCESDCNGVDGLKPEFCQAAHTIAAVRKLSAAKEVERKLLFENVKKLFRI